MLAAAAEKPSVSLTGVKFTSEGGATKVTLDLSGKFEFATDRLEKPERLFFDFAGVRPQTPKSLVNVRDSQLRQIRIGESKPRVTRVVLDLEGSVKYKTTVQTNPYRLIIELTNSSVRSSELDTPAPPPIVRAKNVHRPLVPPPAFYEKRAGAPGTVIQSEAPVFYQPLPDWRKAKPYPLAKLPAFRVAALAKSVPATAKTPTVSRRAPTTGPDSLTRALGLKIRRIMIDPGHGGHDQGSSGPTGLLEKDLVLDVSRRLGALIEAKMGSEVVYTRDDDRFIPLEQRPRLANEAKADLFLSIHANSSTYKAATGVETYYLSFTTSKQALEVAARENAVSEHSVSELRDLLQKIALKDKVDESKEFASRLLGSLIKASPAPATTAQARNRGVKKAPFVVLIGANMPSVLAEIGFISNPKDEQLLKRSEQRDKMAEALLRGLMQYCESLGHLQIAKGGPSPAE